MSDSIYRHDAIKAIETSRFLIDAIEKVMMLPTAQPETNCSEFPNNSDIIYRQAAIAAIDKRFDDVPMELTTEILQLRRDLREMPSAQPETAKRIVGKSRDGMTLWYQCDMCNEPVDAQDGFCRGCGRRLTDE